jgi:hypothetical protein
MGVPGLGQHGGRRACARIALCTFSARSEEPVSDSRARPRRWPQALVVLTAYVDICRKSVRADRVNESDYSFNYRAMREYYRLLTNLFNVEFM